MKKFIHSLVLGVFGFGCFFTWVILSLALRMHIMHEDW